MSALTLAMQILPHAEGLPFPAYASSGAAGIDLVAAIDRTLKLNPENPVLVPTGIAIAMPEGYEGQIRPRSGLALKHCITVLNSPGTIDCDYRGEVKVLLINLGGSTVWIHRGDRIAQLVVAPVTRVEIQRVADLPETARGGGGFGSTGR
jgi:dUTP pyrophosphatase